MKRLFAVISISGLVGLGAFSGTASASSLTVTIPCGCGPLHAGQTGWDTYSQPVGVSSTSPAVANPSGTAGNADNSSGLGPTGAGLTNPSGSASF